jgi:hypothetical protein
MRSALAAFVAGLLAFTGLVAVPFLTRERDMPAAVPSPPPLFTVGLVELRGGQTMCMRDIAIDTRARQARLKVGTFGSPGPPLDFTVTGPGYSSTSRLPGGYPDNLVQTFPVQRPARSQLVTACIRHGGRRKIAFYAAEDPAIRSSDGGRAHSRVLVTVAGKRVTATPTFGFWEDRPVSLGARLGQTAERIAGFRGFLGHEWLVWLALGAFVVGLPAGAGLAIRAAFRS